MGGNPNCRTDVCELVGTVMRAGSSGSHVVRARNQYREERCREAVRIRSRTENFLAASQEFYTKEVRHDATAYDRPARSVRVNRVRG